MMFDRCAVLSLLTLFAVGSAAGQFNCKNVGVVANFQRDKFMGTWYDLARNPTPFDPTLKCVAYKAKAIDNETIDIYKDTRDIYSNKPVYFDAAFVHPANTRTALFETVVRKDGQTATFELAIVEIDYKSHVIFHRCDYEREMEYAWIAARDRTVLRAKINSLVKQLKRKGIETKHLVFVDQDDCPN